MKIADFGKVNEEFWTNRPIVSTKGLTYLGCLLMAVLISSGREQVVGIMQQDTRQALISNRLPCLKDRLDPFKRFPFPA
ncbi:MAG: hypothetical protein K0Q66_442 [Chitinophagaceae bacterium]|nr:hypothetical protein [Chitinophagaceae bacterium]